MGFISDDPLVVSELVSVLNGITGQAPPTPPSRPRLGADDATIALVDSAGTMDPAPTDAPAGAVIVPLRARDSSRAQRLAMAIARKESRPLVIVDRSAEGLFDSPYSGLRGDDDYRPRPDRLFDAAVAAREGRSGTARAITAAVQLGIEAGGWFPVSSGANGIREAIDRFGGSVIVVPESTRRPSVGERIRGMTLESLERLGLPVIVAD